MSLNYMTCIPPTTEEHNGRKYDIPERYEEKHIPLQSQDYYVKVTGRDAEIAITQKFFNDEDERIEAYYKFPLPAEASVHSFEATNDDGDVIVAVCKEKNQAKKEYSNAIEQGNTAYYMDNTDGDVFNIAVGGLSAKSGVTITIKFACELINEGDFHKVRLNIPLTIADQYTPHYQRTLVPDSELNIAKQEEKPYDVSISGDIHMTGKILDVSCYGHDESGSGSGDGTDSNLVSIDSLTHGLKLSKMTGNSAHFEIRNLEELTSDVVLVVERESSESVAYTQELPADVMLVNSHLRYCTSVNIVPDFSKCVQPNVNDAEYVLCLDVSGSMGEYIDGKGWASYGGGKKRDVPTRLDVCKKAAKQFVGLIPNGATFKVVTFESTYHVCPIEGETMMEKKKFATKWISETKPIGGTELYSAFKHIYSTLNPAKNNIIVLITDGQINNDSDVFRLVNKNPSTSVFTLGIGDGVSQNLVKGIAVRGNGQSTFVGPGESGERDVMTKVRDLLALAKSSLRKYQHDYDLAIDSTGQILCLPETGCPLFEKIDNTYYVFSAEPVSSVRFVTYEGEDRVPVAQIITPRTIANADFLLHKIGGIKLINYLEANEQSNAEKPTGSLLPHMQVATDSDDKIKDLIVSISTDLGVLSKHTAFIGVEKKTDPDTSETVLREVPLQAKQMSRYDYSMGGAAACASSAACLAMAPMAATACMTPMAMRTFGPDSSDEETFELTTDGESAELTTDGKSAELTTPRPDPVLVIESNLDVFALSEDMLTSEDNESLLEYLSTLGISHALDVGQIVQLSGQTDADQNGHYEIIGLGSDDEPWVLQRVG